MRWQRTSRGDNVTPRGKAPAQNDQDGRPEHGGPDVLSPADRPAWFDTTACDKRGASVRSCPTTAAAAPDLAAVARIAPRTAEALQGRLLEGTPLIKLVHRR
jgi:hypothetical protein